MAKNIEFHFDFGSPTAYLAFTQLKIIAERNKTKIEYFPILLGGVFKATGNNPPASVPAKGKYMMIDLQRFADKYGVPYERNPYFPVNTLTLMRGAVSYQDDGDFIKELLEEADNERMHLMTFIAIAKPSAFERFIIMAGQFIFGAFYTILYIFFKRTAHRMVGYFEEEAVFSYTEYLNEIDSGKIPNTPAPDIAINYWGLDKNATLKEVIEVIRDDEAGHRDRNHAIADSI